MISTLLTRLAQCLVCCLLFCASAAAQTPGAAVDATTLHGKIMCGYQGWFRCPQDAANMGWIHWSRDSRRIAPDTLTFEMWPDLSDYTATERYATSGFTYPDGRQAELFSSDNARTLQRHFEWMRDYGINGAWLQHFLVDLPGAPNANRYPSRLRVLRHVAAAARQTGRVWALSYDIAGTPTDRIYDLLTTDWKKMVDDGTVSDPRYLRQHGLPVVQIWGFYYQNASNLMTAELGRRLQEFFKTPGPYTAFLVGGGNWDWRRNPDPAWQAMYHGFDAYAPWNIGNFVRDAAGDKHASISWWEDDKAECERHGTLWMPVIYPGFSWDNLTRQPPGTSTIPRRGGRFLWEQFVALAKLKPECIYVAMFDEVDEGTAIFKVTSAPPAQAHFVGYEGLPSDWYLRLIGAGAKMWRGESAVTEEIPIRP